MERKYIESRGFHICVRCPLCGKLHWTYESAIRTGICNSPNCQGCNARKVLTIDEVPDVWKELILWDKQREKLHGKWAVWARCPDCEEERLVAEVSLRRAEQSTGLCKSCSGKARRGKKSELWQGGRYGSTKGYVILNVHGLEGRAKELASKMAHKGGKTIREHRLVMALHLNRPLTKDEIVHHKDGNKSNNAIENLKLLTRRKHHCGHGDSFYQKWQEALSHIRKLEDKIIALGGEVKRFSLFNKAQLKCAFFDWFDWMIPKGQKIFAIDMGETPEEVEETIEKFWRVFVEKLLDVVEEE